MQCPVCSDTRLIMTERQGIEIDYCLHCRGVWLDRGELDKMVERSVSHDSMPTASPPIMTNQQPPHQQYRHHHGKDRHYGHSYKKKKSLLSELFDFD
ncbi:MAG: hypothetical protein FIA89_14170 [Geobacter sp.]|nr:hypothetical protein [Geobacter sp.]